MNLINVALNERMSHHVPLVALQYGVFPLLLLTVTSISM
jgi:hypothetical protein